MTLPSTTGVVCVVSRSILAAGAAAVVSVLARFWGANPEYVDRFLILVAAAGVAWQARPQLAAIAPAPALLGIVPLLIGAAAFPVGWFLQVQVGPKPVGLWWLMVAWVLAAAGTVLLRGGWPHLRLLAFPLIFILFALPIPNRILVPLQFGLQSATTASAAAVLPLLGVPVERSGFVLSLPGGDLGVAEACSGVRSVTALTAIAAFVAWWRGFGFLRGSALVIFSVPIIAGVNSIRVIVSGLIQEHIGADYIRGNWHEALGIAMVLLGLALIVGLAGLLGGRPAPGEPPGPLAARYDHTPRTLLFSRLSATLLCGSLMATLVGHFLGVGTEEALVAAAPIDEISLQIGNWKGIEEPVPEEVASMLTADRIVRRMYRDELGYEVHLWVIFWSSRNMVKGYHHPDVCWPNRGYRLQRRDVVPVEAGGGIVPVTLREFTQGDSKQLILYWTQEGRRVWTEEDERRVQSVGDSHDWLGERLFRRETVGATGRIVVLLGTTVWGDGAIIRTQTLRFAADLAREVYRLCPWAAPPGQ